MSVLELDLPARMIIPGIASFARGERPEIPVPDDGHPWVLGRCWLYCGRDQLWVVWIGPVTIAAATAPMFACAQCIAHLNSLVWEHLLWVDTGEVPASPVLPAAYPPALSTPDPVAGEPDGLPSVPRRVPEIGGGRSHRRPKARPALLAGAVNGIFFRLRRRSRP
ncbi:hypothetical protein [Kitasatospora sp. NPDC092286]|uniref:hypothetical protein n=1 Tax=Kitasatospora sp. NPDC092286 TaxID=3364087 RepID=UPI0038204742